MSKKIHKIEPDSIKDSIVEIKYTSSIPKKLIEGFIYKELTKHFQFSSFNELLPDGELDSLRNNLNLEINPEAHFSNKIITFKVRPNSIIFNIVEHYPLWDVYFKEIKNALEGIYSTGVISSFDRIGIRYINEYPNKQLAEIVNFGFNFNMPEVSSESYSFRSDFKYKNHRIILNLVDGVIISQKNDLEKESKSVNASYVDVDVIFENLKISDTKELFEMIDAAHSIEKEIFFDKILSQEFKKTLKIQE